MISIRSNGNLRRGEEQQQQSKAALLWCRPHHERGGEELGRGALAVGCEQHHRGHHDLVREVHDLRVSA